MGDEEGGVARAQIMSSQPAKTPRMLVCCSQLQQSEGQPHEKPYILPCDGAALLMHH